MATGDKERIQDLWRVHNGAGAARRSSNAANWDDTRTWVDPNGYRLSDRLWNQRDSMRAALDARTRAAIGSGQSAVSLAREIEFYLKPEYAPRRMENGRIIRDGRPGVLTDFPGRPRRPGQTVGYGGTGSYPARRLARTEITRALGQAQIAAADAIPGLLVRWRLSGSHPRIDVCDPIAAANPTNKGPGLYRPNDVPTYPPHPHCLCSLARFQALSDEELAKELRHKYRLGRSSPEQNERDRELEEAKEAWEQKKRDRDAAAAFRAKEAERKRAARAAKKKAQAAQDAADAAARAALPKTLTPAERMIEAQKTARIKTPAQIKNGLDARDFFKTMGVDVQQMGATAKIYRQVAESYQKRVLRGESVMPVLEFNSGSRGIAAYSRQISNAGRPINDRIYISGGDSYWKDPIYQAERMEQSGWLVRGDVDAVIDHEHGHWLHFTNPDVVGYADGGFSVGGQRYARNWVGYADDERIAQRVSKYGSSQPAEYVAEVYSGMQGGKVWDQEIMDLYRRLGGP